MQCGRLLRVAQWRALCGPRAAARGAHTYIGSHTRLREFTQAFRPRQERATLDKVCEIFVFVNHIYILSVWCL